MDVEQLKQAVRDGRVGIDRLVDLIGALARQLDEARRRIEELEKKLGGSASVKVEQPYSLKAEEKRQAARGGKSKRKPPKPLRRGRITTAAKLKLAEREEDVFPAGLDPGECQWSHSRPVWRLENGEALLVGYHIYRAPGGAEPRIPGVTPRCEYGLEILVVLAFLVYVIGISPDKA